MKNKIGVVSTTYPQYSIDEALDGISKAGFKYVELVTVPGHVEHIIPKPEELTKEDADRILNLCKENSLEIYCIAGHTRLMKEDSIRNLKKVIDAAELFGANFITTDTGEVKTKNDEKKFYSDIKELAEYAKLKKLTICLEMHGEWCNNGVKGVEIIKTINLPNVKLNYDTANVMYFGGVKAEDDLEYALPYIAFMHLKDRGGKLGEWNFPPLGSGNMDFKKIFSLIKNYNGPISVEIEFDGKEHSLKEINDAVKKSYDFLKSFGYVE